MIRCVRVVLPLGVLALAACSNKPDGPPPGSTPVAGATAAAPTAVTACPADGKWATCSVVYRLKRAGLVPTVDSTGKPDDAKLGGQPLMVKIGQSAELEVHLYPDSTERIADGAKLDRAQFVNGTAEQTIRREKTLIESANLIGLLTSINAHQRERVADALTAGPPQP